ncbi:MAG: hypothetical protein H8E98_01635, partial [Bacteroidetes bacterium]|nr:hypothetical protein [Bacteroidota bacterium]
MFRKAIFAFFLFFTTVFVFAQNKVVLSGHIIDAGTGEDLIGATVFIEELANTG